MSSLFAHTRYTSSSSVLAALALFLALLLVVVVPTSTHATPTVPTKRQDWQPVTSLSLPYPTALAAVPKLGDLLVILGGAWQNPLGDGVLASEKARITELTVASEAAQKITSDPTNAHLSDEHLQSLVRIAADKELKLRQSMNIHDDPPGGWVPFSVYLDTIVQPNISVLSISENKFLDAFFIAATPANTTTPAPTNGSTTSSGTSFPNPLRDAADATATPVTSSMRSGKQEEDGDEDVPSSTSAPSASGGGSASASSGSTPFPPPNTVLPALLDYASMGISSTVAVQGSLFTLGMCTTIPSYVPISNTDSTLINYLRNVQRLDLLIPRNRDAPTTTPTTSTNATTPTTNSTTSAPEDSSAATAAAASGASFLGSSGLYLADEAERAQHVAARRTLHTASTLLGGGLPPKQRRRGEFKKVAPQVIDPSDDEMIRFYSTNPAAQPDPDAPASDPYTHAIRAGDLRHANRNGPARRAAAARIQDLHNSVSTFVANSHTFSTMSLTAKASLQSDITELQVLLDRADHNDDELGSTTGGLYFSSTTHTITPEMVRFPRFNATCVAYGSNIHVVGGIQIDQDGNMLLSDSIDLYVPASNKFVSGASLLAYPGMSLGITTDDTLMYITGGWMDPDQPSTCQFRDPNGTVSSGSDNENGGNVMKSSSSSGVSKSFVRYNSTVMIPIADATPTQRIAALASKSPNAVTIDPTTGERFVSVVTELSAPKPPNVVSRNTITFRNMATSNQNCFSLSQQSGFFDDAPHIFAINGTIYNCFSHCATIITPSLRTQFPSTSYNTIAMTPTSAYNAPMASFTDSSGVVNMYIIGGYYPGSGTTLTAIFRAQLNQASTFEADVFGFHFFPPTTTTSTTPTVTSSTTTSTTPTTTSTTTTTTTTTTTPNTTTTTTTTPETTTNETTTMSPPTNSTPSASAASSSAPEPTTTTTTTTVAPPSTTTTTTLPPALRGLHFANRDMQAAADNHHRIRDDPPAPPTTTDYPDNDGNFNNLVRHFRPVWVDTPFYVLFESSTPMTTTTTPPTTTTASGTSASSTTTTTTTTTPAPPPSPPLFLEQCNAPGVFCVLRISSDSSCSASIVPDTQLDNTTITADFPVSAAAPLHNTLTGVGPVTIPLAALTPLPGKDGEREGWFGGVTAYICISLGATDLTPLGVCNADKPCNSYFVTPLNSADPFLIMNIVDFVPSSPTTTTAVAPSLPDDDGIGKVTLSYIIIGAVVVACMGIAAIFFVRHVRELRRERDDADERSRLLDSGAAGAANNGQGQLLDGKYRVLQRLGKGSFSVVYLVERVTDFRRFALKYVLCADDLDRTEAIKECDVIHKLQGHPNVIQLFDMFMSYRFDSLASGSINNGAPGRSGGNSAQTRASLQKKKSYDVYDDEYLRNPIVVDRGNNQSAEQNANIAANGERYLSLVMEYHEKGDIGKYIRGVRQYTQRLLQAGGQALNPTFHTQQLRIQLQGQNNGKLSKKQQKENAVILARPPFAEITISEGMVVSIAYQVLSVLHFMHARSPPIIHRDLKPENLLMSSDEYDNVNRDEFLPVVVTDFGLSRVMDATFCETGVGSLPYVAPECWHRQYSTKIDIWALGCILYGICTRRVAADNVKVMFADCSRPDFKTTIKRDVSELSTIAFGLMTPHQLAQAVRQSSTDSTNSSSRRIASGGRGAMDTNTNNTSSTAAANNGTSPVTPTGAGPLVLNSEPASAVEDRPQYLQAYSPQLATFILSMLEPDPNLRPTASQLLQGIKKVYQRRGPAGKVPTAASANATVDRPPTIDGRGGTAGLRDSGDSMASKASGPVVGSVGAVFGKGAAATGQDIQLDAQCVFYVDPEFTEIKDNGMPPASVSANKSLLSKSSSNALRTGSTPRHGPTSPTSASVSPTTGPASPTLPIPEVTLGGNAAARRSSGGKSDVGSIDGDDSRYSEPDDYSV